MTRLRGMLNEAKKTGGSEALVLLICALLIILILGVRFTINYIIVEVMGRSMESTVSDGDILYAERDAAPSHGDIVILDVTAYRDTHQFSGDYIIKRVIGLEGDVVRIEWGAVSVKYAGETEFVKLDEPYTQGKTTASYGETTFRVGEGEIFFLGDNRTDSMDSRAVGCFKLTDVVGVVPGWSVKFRSAITAWEHFRAPFVAKGSDT